jgi:hypothetical protein
MAVFELSALRPSKSGTSAAHATGQFDGVIANDGYAA